MQNTFGDTVLLAFAHLIELSFEADMLASVTKWL